jgi:hypothetical protein
MIQVFQNAQRTFFVDVKKKSKNKEKIHVPFFGILTFGGLFSLKRSSENFLCLLYVYRLMTNFEPCLYLLCIIISN